MATKNVYRTYYLAQARGVVNQRGGAWEPIVYRQKMSGAGFGSFFSSLWRSARPILQNLGGKLLTAGKQYAQTTGKEIGQHLLRSGTQLASDVISGDTEGIKERLRQTGQEVGQLALKGLQNQFGSGAITR